MIPRHRSRRRAYDNGWLRVFEDLLYWPDGGRSVHTLVDVADAAAVLPLHEDGSVELVRQYRHGLQAMSLEVPGGTIDPGETPERAAARELGEELGLAAGRLDLLRVAKGPPAYSRHDSYLYLGRELTRDPALLDPSERLERVRLPFADAVELVYRGEVHSMKSSLAILLAQEYLRHGR